MEFVLGIDSGGTNYRVKASSLDGTSLGMVVGPPASHHYLDKEEVIRRVEESIDCCLAQFGGERQEICYLVCGTTGIDSDEDERQVKACYDSLKDIHCPMKLMNDAELAHYTVTEGKGVLLISGTGSIAFGVNPLGEKARAGGWPLVILGDQGSGIWVTKMALRHMGRWFDHAVETTPLVVGIQKKLEISTRDEMMSFVLKCRDNPNSLPKLGKVVNQAAEAGDPYAEEILRASAMELIPIVEDIVHTLDLERLEPDFCLGLWGSNLLKSRIMLEEFKQKITARYPAVRIKIPEREAIDGAISLALEEYKKIREV